MHNRYPNTESVSSRAQGWPIGASQIQSKVGSLFGYFPNFILKFEPYALYNVQDLDMDWTISRERIRLWIRFSEAFVECHVFKFDKPCAQAYFIT